MIRKSEEPQVIADAVRTALDHAAQKRSSGSSVKQMKSMSSRSYSKSLNSSECPNRQV